MPDAGIELSARQFLFNEMAAPRGGHFHIPPFSKRFHGRGK